MPFFNRDLISAWNHKKNHNKYDWAPKRMENNMCIVGKRLFPDKPRGIYFGQNVGQEMNGKGKKS